MENSLAGTMTVVDDHPVTVLIQSLFGSYRLGNKEQMTDEFTVRDNETMNVCNMFFRHDERMDRRLRINIHKGHRLLVLVNDLCGYFLLDDPAKQAAWVRVHFFHRALRAKTRKKQDRSPV